MPSVSPHPQGPLRPLRLCVRNVWAESLRAGDLMFLGRLSPYLMDLAVIEERKAEPSRPFRDYLRERSGRQ